MSITHEEFQKARRISRAIQEHLEEINDDNLRSTDLYPMLSQKQLIQKDKDQGGHFRRFLKKLKDHDLLHLIPQCKYEYSKGKTGHIQWRFYRSNSDVLGVEHSEGNRKRKLIAPTLPEAEIDELIEQARPHIDKLPKINENKLILPQLETRKMYPRAYEFWTERELEILERAYKKFGRIDKVAELLKRQPSAVRERLEMKKLL